MSASVGMAARTTATFLTEPAFDGLLSAAPHGFIVQSTGNYFPHPQCLREPSAGGVVLVTFASGLADATVNEFEI